MQADTLKLLAVDDNDDNLVSLTALIRAYLPDCQVACARSGKEGIGMARTFEPDTILLDIQMPGMDGFDTCRALKVDPATRHIPVIFLTAQSGDPASRIKGLEIGGDAFLSKPIEPGELIAQVRAMVRIKRSEDVLRGEKYALERIVAERTAAFKEGERRFRLLFEKSPVGYQSLDINGTFLEVNEAWLGLLGYTHEEVIGRWFGDFLAPGGQDHFRANFPKFLAAGEISGVEFLMPRKDGATILVSFTGKIGRDENGEFKQTHCVLADITERRRAEDELRSARAFLANVINAIADPVFVKDDKRRFVLVNDALCTIVGRSREDLFGEDGDDMFPSEEVEVFREMDTLVLDSGQENVNEEHLSNLSNGEVRTIVTRKSRYVDPAGRRFLVGVIRDITERKQTEAALAASQTQLLQAQKMEAIGRLAGGVAHDFNNILQAMLSQIQALQLGASAAELHEGMAEIEAYIRSGAGLTRQLLLFSRHELVEPTLIDLGEVVSAAVSMLRRLLPENIRLAVEIAPQRLWVTADVGQLEQAVINLALNARDAMPGGGVLTVSANSAEGEVSFDVVDTGHGMDEQCLAHLFEPFFTTKAAGHGSGLGLSVVHGVVEQYGGRIEVCSSPGEGSRFRIVFPGAPGQPAAKDAAEETAAPPRGQGESVLVVEDESGARIGITKILTRLGYRVTAVASAEEALILGQTPVFDLLLTDLMLQGISGSELAGQLSERWPTLKVILMSGYTEDHTSHGETEYGAWRFLQKPFDMTALAREVRQALDAAGEDARVAEDATNG